MWGLLGVSFHGIPNSLLKDKWMRKVLFWGLLLGFCLTGCGEKRDQFPEREFISLDGLWSTHLGDIFLPGTVDESKLADRNNDTVNTGRLTRLYPFEGKITYSREIEIPHTAAHKEWRLVMERTKPSVLKVDGDSIGSSTLILSPQKYHIGRLTAGKHMLSIEVDNSPESVPAGIHGSHAWTDATQTNWNGVIGEFRLEAYEGILIEDMQLFPDIEGGITRVKALVRSSQEGEAEFSAEAFAWNTDAKSSIPRQYFQLSLKEGVHTYEFTLNNGEDILRWSEFDPVLYQFRFTLCSEERCDYYKTDIGFREFVTEGTQFQVNGLKTFLRGKHDACIFPLTGYPPMEKEEWKRQMRISKEYGMNHYRFHSWTPPRAAFEAADEEGIYMQAELPYWGMMDRENTELNDFLLREGEAILRAYGNHPSMVMMALGNELGGDTDYMRTIVEGFRESDNRRLYAFGANNALGTAGQVDGEDFLLTCRVGGEVGSDDYSTHTRATFSFADAKDGGYMNGLYPSTDRTFSTAIASSTVPVISHESGQFQVYPDYAEIEKYKGVLYPYNMEVFWQRLQQAGLAEQADDFHRATARFAALCYKADIEMCLRTPGFGGFQLLDLQDYPGQGSAYVGLLDAFMDSKGALSPEEFRRFCGEVVPLALFPRYCWDNDETFSAVVKISNYSKEALQGEEMTWQLLNEQTNEVISSGTIPDVLVPQGELTEVGVVSVALQEVEKASRLRLELNVGDYANAYDLWVYPVEEENDYREIVETTSLQHAIDMLAKGEKVLFSPDHAVIEDLSVGGLFTPDYWNYAMFKNISEHLNRAVSPGTLSLLTDPAHPLFTEFPTEMHSNWQWWIITRNARPFILDRTLSTYKPLIQVVDNIERNHKLGILFEMKVGEGALLVNMCDLEAIADKPEGRQYRRALLQYIASPDFMPNMNFTAEEVLALFTAPVKGRDIKGVRNITSYE